MLPDFPFIGVAGSLFRLKRSPILSLGGLGHQDFRAEMLTQILLHPGGHVHRVPDEGIGRPIGAPNSSIILETKFALSMMFFTLLRADWSLRPPEASTIFRLI